MTFERFHIEGLVLIKNKRHGDARGFFTERFRKDAMLENQLPVDYCQENYSRSAPNVLRGLHYQYDQPQGKLVTCTQGRIFDVAVDIRKGSPTFGQHVAVELSGDDPAWFWVPYGFAHGFYVMGDQTADLMYKVDNYYNPQGEGGLMWNDPELKIKWPTNQPILSERDKGNSSLSVLRGVNL